MCFYAVTQSSSLSPSPLPCVHTGWYMTISKFGTSAKTERMGFESDQKAVAEKVVLFILSMYCPRTYRVLLILYVVFITPRK